MGSLFRSLMPDVLTRSGWNLSAKTPKAARRQKKGSKAAEEKSDSVPYEPVPPGPPEDKENTNDAQATPDPAAEPAADSEVSKFFMVVSGANIRSKTDNTR